MPPDPHPDSSAAPLYDTAYGRFDQDLYRDIRRETWGDDFGQNGWITAAEQDRFIDRLALGRGDLLLDLACGSGGPTLRIAQRTGAAVTGIDLHADAIAVARRQAAALTLPHPPSFQPVDASGPLPFQDGSFDALICIDAINHLPDRPRVLSDWRRVLKPRGRAVFTDPVVITGPVSAAELAVRSSIGYFLFTPAGVNERLIADAGLQLQAVEDLTPALAAIASRWHAARQSRAADLAALEGQREFEAQQRFLQTSALLAQERRLSRFAYAVTRPA